MGAGTVYEELDEAKANIENLQASYKIKLELSESLKSSYNEQLIKNQEASLKIENLSQQVNEKDALLEEAKAENEKLKENYQTKVENSESLRRAHNEVLNKNQEAVSKIEKLSQELYEKIEEISLVREKYEEIEVKFKEKDALVKHVTSLYDKLRVESKDKITDNEDEILRLGLALEEANEKYRQQEQLMKSFQEEINRIKGHGSVSKRTGSETRSKSFNETSQRDDILQKMEEEKYRYENQLKWKNEQFNHLRDAHEKLRTDFRVKEREFEKEKASLVDDLSILETKLDSQIRVSESLKSRLEMCNNALSHAESKRKLLEVELAETKSSFGNAYAEFEEGNSTVEHLTGERDNEIARLRGSLGEKENLYKELEYKVKILENEKEDLLSSLKELEETQIQGGEDPSSLTKLRNNKLKAKESELNSKTELIKKLKIEIQTRDFMILEQGLHNEEVEITLLALKSELSAAKPKFFSDPYDDDSSQNDKEVSEPYAFANVLTEEDRELSTVKEIERLKKELSELKNQNLTVENTLNEVRYTLWRTNEELDVKFCEAIELDFELQIWKSTAQELKTKLEDNHLINCTAAVEATVHSQMRTLKNQVKKLRSSIDRANEELAEKFVQGTEIEFQLQIWKSIAEQLNKKVEESQNLRIEVEASLLAQTCLEVNLKQEKADFLTLLEEKDKKIHSLEQKHGNSHEEDEEWMKREIERAIFVQVIQHQVEEKDQRTENLRNLQINSFHQAWDEVTTTVIMKEMEIQEKNQILIEMENVLKLSSNRLNELCDEDMQLTERLDCIMQGFDHEEMESDMKENRNMVSTPMSSSKHEGILDQRSPFRAINN